MKVSLAPAPLHAGSGSPEKFQGRHTGADDIPGTEADDIPGRGVHDIPGTVSGAIFDGLLEVFWIFLKNEHGKVKGTRTEPKRRCRENQALCNLII